MSRTITIDPVTRIEGHARVEIDIDDSNKVTSSVFKVLDFRGWETFLQGMQVEMMPTITPRICGTCPCDHHLASAKTVDKVFGVTIPPAAEKLRIAMQLGSLVHSHGVHFFALAAPDLLLGVDSDPASRNIVGLIAAAPDVARKALRVRTIGHRVMELIGGRGTHPVSAVGGGVAAPLDKDKGEALKRLAAEGLTLGGELFAVAKQALTDNLELVQSISQPTHYLATVNGGALDHYQGTLRLRGPQGGDTEFEEDAWADHLSEEATATSYAKYVFCQKGDERVSYRVGPLARVNCCDSISTPLAAAELQAFRELGGHPCHQTFMYHYARLIELLHGLERLVELTGDPELYSDQVRVKTEGTPRSATSHVEAMRGTLIHDYKVDANGIVERANLLVATQQNIGAINESIGLAAQTFMDKPDPFLLNAIEMSIRCYDPCLSCATHRIGEMKLDVLVRQNGEVVRRVRR